ncbi:DnaD domain protein [Mycoplasmatota bacterium]|nr:DnaD domain protein [Mycoplasmatota bacterium]
MKNSSNFKIYMQSNLSNSDFKVLSLLYQPLLGMEAYAIYTTFYHLVQDKQQNETTHQILFDLLNLKQTNFLKMRQKLEALSLIETYQKADEYIYILKTPLTAKQFLTDTVFGSYLQSEIGEENLNVLIDIFKKEDPMINDFKNISKSFDALYEFKQLNLLKVDHLLEGRIQNQGLLIKSQFDFNGFVELLPERLKTSALINKKLQETLEKIAYVYQFDISDMVEIYKNASMSKQAVNYQALNFKAKQHFENKNQVLTIKEKTNSEVDLVEKATPYEIVSKFAKVNQQGLALSTAFQLLERNHVEPGIINVILMLVLKNKDGILPHINYMEKVLNDWLNKGIRTTEDAINYASKLESSFEKKPTKKKKTGEPDWMDDYMKKIAEMEV